MQNVETKMDGKKLIITIDTTQRLGASRSGKSDMVATTGGNAKLPGGLELGLNLFTKKPVEKVE